MAAIIDNVLHTKAPLCCRIAGREQRTQEERRPTMTRFDGEMSPPFEIVEPATWRAPIIFNSPHSGSSYPNEFLTASRIDLPTLRRSEDSFMDDLIGDLSARGFAVIRVPSVKSCRKFLALVREWLLQHIHWSRREQQSHLRAMLQGFYQYFSLHHCAKKLSWIHREVQQQWRRALCRQGQRHKLHWSYLETRD